MQVVIGQESPACRGYVCVRTLMILVTKRLHGESLLNAFERLRCVDILFPRVIVGGIVITIVITGRIVSTGTTLLCFSRHHHTKLTNAETRCMTSSALRTPIIHRLSTRSQTRKNAPRSSSSYCSLCCPLPVQEFIIRKTLAQSQRKVRRLSCVLLRFSCLV